ncbi:hypothetical protein PCASD_19651 [Puccinia coronata f. sp. avenae]|uniref:Uncharacterized protein n=1 Tax=Puccinia coronata f. sp. avenae TaxID=200324 RepID=A0A2N5TIS3_9BASI|nr:hypothetical protein PCASD_24183 [Puccinia coronata f. sp. avenae]PLW26377.1 hypothetical protein PCASD_19651 [Puccinia coronata f. sp. avenae]
MLGLEGIRGRDTSSVRNPHFSLDSWCQVFSTGLAQPSRVTQSSDGHHHFSAIESHTESTTAKKKVLSAETSRCKVYPAAYLNEEFGGKQTKRKSMKPSGGEVTSLQRCGRKLSSASYRETL